MDIASVLIDRYPGQQWNLTNNDYDTLVWESVNNVHKPTLEELETIWPTVLNTKKLNEARDIFKSSSGLDNITEFNMSKFKYIMNGN